MTTETQLWPKRVRSEEDLRDALKRFIDRGPVMTIPVDLAHDADIILSDGIYELVWLRRVQEDAETLLRIIGKRALYPAEDDWELIANCASALREALAKAPVQHSSVEEK